MLILGIADGVVLACLPAALVAQMAAKAKECNLVNNQPQNKKHEINIH
jgi:hypothetical protein